MDETGGKSPQFSSIRMRMLWCGLMKAQKFTKLNPFMPSLFFWEFKWFTVYTLTIWKVNVPPKVLVFLGLLSNNKLMTVDNLLKKGVSKHCFANSVLN